MTQKVKINKESRQNIMNAVVVHTESQLLENTYRSSNHKYYEKYTEKNRERQIDTEIERERRNKSEV